MAKRATTYSLFLCVKGGLQLGVEFQNLKAKKYNPLQQKMFKQLHF